MVDTITSLQQDNDFVVVTHPPNKKAKLAAEKRILERYSTNTDVKTAISKCKYFSLATREEAGMSYLEDKRKEISLKGPDPDMIYHNLLSSIASNSHYPLSVRETAGHEFVDLCKRSENLIKLYNENNTMPNSDTVVQLKSYNYIKDAYDYFDYPESVRVEAFKIVAENCVEKGDCELAIQLSFFKNIKKNGAIKNLMKSLKILERTVSVAIKAAIEAGDQTKLYSIDLTFQ